MPELNFNVLAQQGPQNFMQGYAQGNELRNRMAQQRQQEQLAELQVQNALREQRMAGEEEAAYKAAGSDMGRLQQELMQRGLGKQSMAVGAQITKQQADKIAMLKQQHDLIKTAAAQVFANPENAIQSLTAFGNRTGIDMSDDLAQIQALGSDPAKIKQWAAGIAMEADKLVPKFQSLTVAGVGTKTGTIDPMTGKFIEGQTYKEEISPYQQETLAISGGQLALQQQKFAWEKANPGMEIKEGPSGEMLAVNKRTGEAKPVMMGGTAVAGAGKPLTESQAKAANFAGRMESAFKVVDGLESDPTVLQKLVAGNSWTNILAPETAQQYRQAQENWVSANLRKESGAVIGSDEMNKEIKKYFPIPGDKPQVIEQKRQARLDAMAGMEAEATERGIKSVKESRKALGERYQRKPAESAAPNIDALLDKYK